MAGKARTQIVNRRWRSAYVVFSTVIAVAACIRLQWAFPEASWQSSLLFVNDIDRLLSGHLGDVTWYEFTVPHALNGYRWIQYLNAALFGLNTQVELWAYYAIVLAISIIVGMRSFESIERSNRILPRIVLFAIPVVMASMSGAGSRGMELGTYTGVLLTVILFILLESRMTARQFSLVAVPVVILIVFAFLGGYAAGPLFALAVVAAAQRLRPTCGDVVRSKLLLLLGAFFITCIAYALVMRAVSPIVSDSGIAGLRAQIADNVLFPAKYLFLGWGAAVISNLSLEHYEAHGTAIRSVIAALVLGLVACAVVSAFRSAWSRATIPLLLITYAVGVELMLLFTRNDSFAYALSPWYSMHFKVGLAGAIWLVALSLASVTPAWSHPAAFVGRVGAVAGVCLILCVVVAANVIQFKRQPFERVYFQNVQRAILDPATIIPDGQALTPLVLPYTETITDIGILRHHRLGLYRHDSSGQGGSVSQPKDLVVAGVSGDGWAGSDVILLARSASCPQVRVVIDSRSSKFDNIVTVSEQGQRTRKYVIGKEVRVLAVKTHGFRARIHLTFARTWIPAEVGDGEDLRSLAAQVGAVCFK